MAGIEVMPLTEALFRPRRLKMRGWTRKRLEWQIKTAHALEALPAFMAARPEMQPDAV